MSKAGHAKIIVIVFQSLEVKQSFRRVRKEMFHHKRIIFWFYFLLQDLIQPQAWQGTERAAEKPSGSRRHIPMYSRTFAFSVTPHSKPKPEISAVFSVSIRFCTGTNSHAYKNSSWRTHRVLTRLQALVCFSPQRPSHDRFSTCLFKNKQKYSPLPSLNSCYLNLIPSFIISPPLVPSQHSHASQCQPGLSINRHLFLPLDASFPSGFPLLHQTPLPTPLPTTLPSLPACAV